MRSPRRTFRYIVLPLTIAAPLLWVMVGCIYIPTFKSTERYGAKQNFTPLMTGDRKMIVVGTTAKRQVEELLGAAPMASANGRVAVYFNVISQGVWIEPICATALWADRKLYALELTYDEHFLLIGSRIFSTDCTKKAHGIEFIDDSQQGYLRNAMRVVIDEVNASNGLSVRPYHFAIGGGLTPEENRNVSSPFYLDPDRLPE